MPKKLVEVIVNCALGGKTKVEVKGMSGNACLKETQDLEEALGKVSSRKMTPEGSTTPIVKDTTKVGA